MTNTEAIRRLKDHFAIHDDGRPTPYLNEAVRIAYEALETVYRLEQAEAKDNDTIYDMCCRFSCDTACKGCSFRRRELRCEKTTDFFNGYNQALADIRADQRTIFGKRKA